MPSNPYADFAQRTPNKIRTKSVSLKENIIKSNEASSTGLMKQIQKMGGFSNNK